MTNCCGTNVECKKENIKQAFKQFGWVHTYAFVIAKTLKHTWFASGFKDKCGIRPVEPRRIKPSNRAFAGNL